MAVVGATDWASEVWVDSVVWVVAGLVSGVFVQFACVALVELGIVVGVEVAVVGVGIVVERVEL